jgi:site-specific recombinase XerD
VGSYVEGYIRNSMGFNKSSTVDDKNRTLSYFVKYVEPRNPAQCTGDIILAYLKDRRGAISTKPISAERWNSERQIISNFFKWLQGQKLIDHNPAQEVRKQKVVRNKIPKCLTRQDEKRLLRWCRSKDPELFRMAVVVGNTGIRVRELANLSWTDIGETLNITAKPGWSPKDYEERSIPLSAIAKAVLGRQHRTALSMWVFPRSDGERYGRGLDLRMVRAFKKAGLGSGGFHRLRHTFATRFMEAGGEPEALRRILGHADLKTLGKYLHVSPEHIKRQASLVKFGG